MLDRALNNPLINSDWPWCTHSNNNTIAVYFLFLQYICYYTVSLRIQSEWGKMRTRKTPNMDTFQAVFNFRTIFKSYFWWVKVNFMVSEKFWNTWVIYTTQDFFHTFQKKPKIVYLKWDLPYKLIRICWIQSWCSLFLFWTENTLFWGNLAAN